MPGIGIGLVTKTTLKYGGSFVHFLVCVQGQAYHQQIDGFIYVATHIAIYSGTLETAKSKVDPNLFQDTVLKNGL